MTVDPYDHLSAEGAEMAIHKAQERILNHRDDAWESLTGKIDNKTAAPCNYASSDLVVWWFNGIFKKRKHANIVYPSCDVSCVEAGSDESCGKRADAIVYHLPTHTTEPKFRHKLSIGLSYESTANYPYQNLGTLKKQAGYDLAATTNFHSDMPIMYFNNFSLYDTWGRAGHSPGFHERLPAAAFVARNCAQAHVRSDFVSKLAELGVPVHSLGLCAPRGTEAKYTREIGTGDKVSFIKKYRVYLAFENTVEPGYVSEKIFDGYKAGCIQAYYGAPDVDKFVPPNSMIRVPHNIQDKAAMADAAAKIKAALHDENIWEQLNGWKQTPVSEWNGGAFLKHWGKPGTKSPDGFFASISCRMCRAAYAHKYPDRARFNKTSQNLEFV
eukprot:CAMPEP_0168424746 /NCGR_PEP_ID=MMETSP0228-20121227/34976_1 /TAXON_ID=133427 /ORGANISM="Protoceratium reticulatum, Strain CCCM 535 (=CCMP 1889)" /LENGTH=383 /DNA_ID=CAMNT_0008438735 /DNA_START=182 /DNA_END=1333 /DNA_ORIENTATION=+